jgi:hypothetical protein
VFFAQAFYALRFNLLNNFVTTAGPVGQAGADLPFTLAKDFP